jgi:actin-related protein 2
MQVNPSEFSVFLTEPALNPKENREKLVETVLEDFQFAACKVETQATLTLVSQAKSTGMVLDSGDGVTHIVPICDGYILEKSIRRINIAGHDISCYLANLFLKRGYRFFSSYDIDQVRKIKEECCYLSTNPIRESNFYSETTSLNRDYRLPDGNWVTIRSERYQAAEVLFYPGLLGKEEFNIADIVVDSLEETPEDYKVELASNVLLSGGTTMLPGFAQRLKMVVREKMKEKNMAFKVKINDPLNRKILVFLGAAIVALIIESDPEQWISREEYLEEGSRCVYKFDS